MPNKKIDLLLDEIEKIPGDKIVTLISSSSKFVIDVSKEGEFGYSPTHKPQFLNHLHTAMMEGGGMTIRQFLDIRIKRRIANEEEMWIPEKNIYGVFLGNNDWKGIDADTMECHHNTDVTAGQPLSPEEAVHYKSFPI